MQAIMAASLQGRNSCLSQRPTASNYYMTAAASWYYTNLKNVNAVFVSFCQSDTIGEIFVNDADHAKCEKNIAQNITVSTVFALLSYFIVEIKMRLYTRNDIVRLPAFFKHWFN